MSFESVLGTSIRARQGYTSDVVFGYVPPGPSVVYVSDFNAFWFHLGGPTNVWQPLVPTAPQMVSVTLNQTTVGLVLGGSPNTAQLIATTFDASGNPLGGRTYTWASSNTGVATVSATGLVTAAGAGSCNVTVTDTGVTANCAVTVTSTTSNEPGGMTVQVDTGAISLTSAQLQGTTWTVNGYTFSNFSPTTPSASGEWRGNLVQPDATTGGGTGAQLNYPVNPALRGNSPVRFGIGLPTGAAAGVLGIFYARYIQTYSANWVQNAGTGMKNWEPRVLAQGSGAGATENHVIGATFNFSNNNRVLQTAPLLQGPNGQSFTPPPLGNTIGIVTGGQPHKVEHLWQMDNPPGAHNATIQIWVDGVLAWNATGLTLIANANTPGWPFWMCDPTYGGNTGGGPTALMSWKFDQLHVSTK